MGMSKQTLGFTKALGDIAEALNSDITLSEKLHRLVRSTARALGVRGCSLLLLDAQNRVARINRLLLGWSNYFCLGPVSKAYGSVDRHTRRRLRQWLRAKHKVQGEGTARFPDAYLHQELGLLQLQERTRSFPWANA